MKVTTASNARSDILRAWRDLEFLGKTVDEIAEQMHLTVDELRAIVTHTDTISDDRIEAARSAITSQ